MQVVKRSIGGLVRMKTPEAQELLSDLLAGQLADYPRGQTAVPLLLGAPGVGKSESSRRALVLALRRLAAALWRGADVKEIARELRSVGVEEGAAEVAEALASERDKAVGPLPAVSDRVRPLLASLIGRAAAASLKLAEERPELADPESPLVVHYRPDVPVDEYRGAAVWININVSSSPLLKLAGLPYVGKDMTKTYPPEWAVVAKKALIAVVNIDEVTNEMDPERTSLLYSLTLNKTVGDFKFGHPGVFVVGTGNTADTSSLVASLPGPLVAGRFSQILVEPPSVADWIEYMFSSRGTKWDVRVAYYLLREPEKLMVSSPAEFSEVVPGKTPSFPTPRGWTAVAVALWELGDPSPEEADLIAESAVGIKGAGTLILNTPPPPGKGREVELAYRALLKGGECPKDEWARKLCRLGRRVAVP